MAKPQIELNVVLNVSTSVGGFHLPINTLPIFLPYCMVVLICMSIGIGNLHV